MKKLLFLFLIFSTLWGNILAATTLIEKQALSGYVLPEHAFNKQCRIFSEGHMEATIIKGDGTAIGFAHTLPSHRIHLIKVLLGVAKSGVINESPMPCDIGSRILRGYLQGKLVELDVAIDCGTRRLNTSPMTQILKSIIQDICTF